MSLKQISVDEFMESNRRRFTASDTRDRAIIKRPPSYFEAASDCRFDAYYSGALHNADVTVLQYTMTNSAAEELQAEGAKIGPIPPSGAKRYQFQGQQLVIPPNAFPTFNRLQASGQIVVAPYSP